MWTRLFANPVQCLLKIPPLKEGNNANNRTTNNPAILFSNFQEGTVDKSRLVLMNKDWCRFDEII